MNWKMSMCALMTVLLCCCGSIEQDNQLSINDIPLMSRQSTRHPSKRSIRGANEDDPFSLAIEHMQQMIRLTTGIRIQLGLLDGKMTIDDLVSRLFHLGKASVSQIMSTDGSEKLKMAFESMKQLPRIMKGDYRSGLAEEKKLKAVDEMRVLLKGIDAMEWEGREVFLEEMKRLKKNDAVFGNVFAMGSTIKSLAKDIEAMRDPNIFIRDMFDPAQSLVNRIGNFAKNDSKVWTWPKIESATDALRPVIDAVNAAKKAYERYTEVAWGDEDKVFPPYYSMFRNVVNVSRVAIEAVPSVQVVSSVISRQPTTRRSPEHSGFLTGYRDIEKMFADFTSGWMGDLVDVDTMTVFLRPLKTLIPYFERIEKELESLEVGKWDLLERIVDDLREISKLTEMPSIADRYINCSRTYVSVDPDSLNVTKFLEWAAKLDTRLTEGQRNARSLFENLGRDEIRKWFEDRTNKVPPPTDKNGEVYDVWMYRWRWELNQIDIHFDYSTSRSYRFNDEAHMILELVPSVDAFQKTYKTIFDCFQSNGNQEAEDVTRVVKLIEKIRAIEMKDVFDGEGVYRKVNRTAKYLEQMANITSDMQPTADSDVFSRKLVEWHVEQVRTATRGVSEMKRAIEERDRVEEVIESVALAQALLVNNPFVKDQLKVLTNLTASLKLMNEQLDEWQSAVRNTSFPDLPSYSQLFSAAKRVRGVAENLGEMGYSVDGMMSWVINPPEIQQLHSLKASLDTLASFQLDFSSFAASFDASKHSLNVLEVFFASTRPTPPPPPPPSTTTTMKPPTTSTRVEIPLQLVLEDTSTVVAPAPESGGGAVPLWMWLLVGVLIVLSVLSLLVLHRVMEMRRRREVETLKDRLHGQEENHRSPSP